MKQLADLRVAIVGYGAIGHRHEQNLLQLGVRQRLVVRRPSGANAAFRPSPDVTVVYSSTEAIAQGVDVALICLPTSLHVDAAMEFVEAGIAVLVENPLSDALAGAVRLVVATRDEKNVAASMAYCLRYHPAYAAARWAINSGQIGQVLYAKAWCESFLPNWHPWENYRTSYAARPDLGGGVLPTLDHEIDFLTWCFGRPRQVAGWQTRTAALETKVADLANLWLEFDHGAVATVCQSLCRHDPSRGFEIIGQRGTLTYALQRNRLELHAAGQAESEVLWDGLDYDPNDMYVALLRDFLSAVAARRPTPIPLDAGLDALEVVQHVAEFQAIATH